jgi:hypothetical protein
MTDNPVPELPRSVLEEIKDCLGEVHEDFEHSILRTPRDVHTFFRQLTLDLINSGRDVSLVVDDFATSMMWMILIGREHATRGFGPPLERDDRAAKDVVSDDMISRFLNGETDE